MNKPNHPTADAILLALDTLNSVTDWSIIVSDLDGVDARLGAVGSLANCLSGFSIAVSDDIDAVAYGEQKEACKSDEPHSLEMFANSYASNLQAAQAVCYAGFIEEAHDRFRELEQQIKEVPDEMSEKDFFEKRDQI